MVPQPSLSYGLRSDPGSASTNCSGLSDRPLAIGALAATIFSVSKTGHFTNSPVTEICAQPEPGEMPMAEKVPGNRVSWNACNRTVTLVRSINNFNLLLSRF